MGSGLGCLEFFACGLGGLEDRAEGTGGVLGWLDGMLRLRGVGLGLSRLADFSKRLRRLDASLVCGADKREHENCLNRSFLFGMF